MCETTKGRRNNANSLVLFGSFNVVQTILVHFGQRLRWRGRAHVQWPRCSACRYRRQAVQILLAAANAAAGLRGYRSDPAPPRSGGAGRGHNERRHTQRRRRASNPADTRSRWLARRRRGTAIVGGGARVRCAGQSSRHSEGWYSHCKYLYNTQ